MDITLEDFHVTDWFPRAPGLYYTHEARDARGEAYAHAAKTETGWVERIRLHLQGLVQSSDFEVWDHTKIGAGNRWREEIERAISHTRVAVLVLTAEFMASDFIRKAELPPLLEAVEGEGATILCIYGSDVHLSGIAGRLKQYRFVNKLQQPLLALTRAECESVYKDLTMAVERAIG